MRRKQFSILLALPVANGLSLANFQEITSILIPLSCQLTYDSQIATCTKSDFTNGCSAACVAALQSKASDVSDSCALVIVSSNTLLGIVKGGGIVAALCPTIAKTTSTVQKSSTTAVAISNTVASTVTIPTNSGGNTGGLGLKTSTSSKATSTVPAPQSIVSTTSVRSTSSVVSITVRTSSTVSSATSSIASTTSTADSSNSGSGSEDGGSSTITTTTSTSSSKKGSIATSSSSTTTTKASSQGDNSSGGGSPFDISSGATRLGEDSMMGLVILVVACILGGR